MKKQCKPKPYGVVRAEANGGYGHVNVRFYDIFDDSSRSPSLVITSQCDNSGPKLYAWRCGVEAQMREPMGTRQLREGARVMAKVDRGLAKFAKEGQDFTTFDQYIVGVFQALGVRKLHIVDAVGGGIPRAITDLPVFDCLAMPIEARERICSLIANLYARV